MKKRLILFTIFTFLLVGCSMGNTPTAKVEELLNKYVRLDSDISSNIDSVLENQNLTKEHQERYRKVLEKQYKNLTYEIKEEVIDGDSATVVVEIEVVDYKKAISDLTFDSTTNTKENYDEEKLTRLENAEEKVKYTLEITTKKDTNGTWKVNALTNEQIKKIEGMY